VGTAAAGYTDGSINALVLGTTSVVPLATAQHAPLFVSTDGVNVYWTDSGSGEVAFVPVAGGVAPTVLASGLSQPAQLVTDGTNLYWINQGTGTVMKFSAFGETPATVASDQGALSGIAANTASVIWANVGTAAASYTDGSIVGTAQ
jgi:hypothetical protein